MSHLASHHNVFPSCLALLDREGWRLWVDPVPYEDDDALHGDFHAERDGTEIIASNPIELLGLAKLHDHHHPYEREPYWWRVSPREPGLMDRLEDEALERSFEELRGRDPVRWRAYLEEAIAEATADPTVSAADRLGVSQAYFDRVTGEG